MTALAPSFHSVDHIAGLNLNYRNCCWVHYGSEGREYLLGWLSDTCEEFHEMQTVRHAKYVGTMIDRDGHIHRWTAPRKNFIQRVFKINSSTRSLVEVLCDLKIYALSVCVTLAPYAHVIRLLSRLRPMPFSVQPQDRTTLYLLTY